MKKLNLQILKLLKILIKTGKLDEETEKKLVVLIEEFKKKNEK